MNNPYLAPAESPVQDPSYSPYGAGAAGPGAGGMGDRAEVSDAAIEALRQTRPWVMFLSVMAFIGSAFMLFGGIIVMVAGAFIPRGAGGGAAMSTAALGAFYIPFAFLYIYPALKMWSFGSAISRLVASRSSFDLEAALRQQKSFWKFAGIVTVVMVAMYFLFFVGMMVVGISAAGRH